MKVVLQRVSEASVEIENHVKGKISNGLLVLLGIESDDSVQDSEWLVRKLVQMRIFPDDEGNMNQSILDSGGDILVISQFTLHASTKKGNRPSFIRAARPEQAIPLYEKFIRNCEQELGKPVETGEFGAHMQISLVNDGPVTIILDSKNKE